MARTALDSREAKEIRRRLHQFVEEVHDGDWQAFQQRVRVERTTVSGWKNSVAVGVPDAPNLLRLAKYGRMNLNWLLLGEGPKLCDEPQGARSPSAGLREALVAHFAATDCDDVAEAERCIPDARYVWWHVIHSLGPIVRGTRVIIKEQKHQMAILSDSIVERAAAGDPACKKLVQHVAKKRGITAREVDRILRRR